MGNKMRNSEIFNSFVKIAQENGLISSGKKDEEKPSNKDEKPSKKRDQASYINSLYNVKIDRPKDMEYKNNIMEDAHPDTLVISPSYDKLNGLIENNIERQNILLRIVNSPTDGLLINRKFAEKEFILSLVKVANDLDNNDKEELRILADSCLDNLYKKPIKKTAFPFAIVGGIAALIGTIYAQQHLNFHNDGFEQNHAKLLDEVEDLINSHKGNGVGYDLSPEFKDTMVNFKSKLESFYNLYKKVYPIVNNIQKPKTAKDLKKLMGSPETATVIKAYTIMKNMFDDMSPYLKNIQRNFASESYKATQIKDKGWLTSIVDSVSFLHGGKGGLVADDFDDVSRALPPYVESVNDILKVLKDAKSYENKAKDELQSANANQKKPMDFDKTNKDLGNSDKDVEKADKAAYELSNDLSGGLI